MGLKSWLSSAKMTKLITRLQYFTKMMEMEKRRIEREARNHRMAAKKYRMEGNNEAARIYAEHAARYQKWALALDLYRVNIDSLVIQLKQANFVGDVTKLLGQLKGTLISLQRQLNMPELIKLNNEIQKQLTGISISTETAFEGMSALGQNLEVSESDVNKILSEIDAEIQVETGIQIPSASEAPVSQDVRELEKDIKKLRDELK